MREERRLPHSSRITHLASRNMSRKKPAKPAVPLRVLMLMDREFLPPDDVSGMTPEQIRPFKAELEDLKIQANTGGRDAVGEVNLRVRVDGKTFTGRGASPGTAARRSARSGD